MHLHWCRLGNPCVQLLGHDKCRGGEHSFIPCFIHSCNFNMLSAWHCAVTAVNKTSKTLPKGAPHPWSFSSKRLDSPLVYTKKDKLIVCLLCQFALIIRLSRPLADEAVYILQVGWNFTSLVLHPSCLPLGLSWENKRAGQQDKYLILIAFYIKKKKN